MMTYYFVCASILNMCLYLWEKVRLVENGLQDNHNVCSAGVEVPKYRSSNGDDLQFTPKCVVHNKNGSPLYNTMFILFDIHILYDSKTFVFVVITNALTSIANPPTQ